MQPAVAQRPRRFLRQIEIALHHIGTSHHQFADFPIRQIVALRIDDPHGYPGNRQADGQVLGPVLRIRGHDRRGL